MENVTHSLTGALAAKLIRSRASSVVSPKAEERRFFWFVVISANLPDIDVVLALFMDPIHSFANHRGITHSFVFAPVLALFPTFLLYAFGRTNQFLLYWFGALCGIILHILLDLITSFGTQIFAPFSTERHSLDLMYVVDPFFTAGLALFLMLGKLLHGRQKAFTITGSAFTVFYVSLELACHTIAMERLTDAVHDQGIKATRTSALPQPFSVFRWSGLAQTVDADVRQVFINVLSRDRLRFTEYNQSRDVHALEALATKEAQWYMSFARYPWVQTNLAGDSRIVEFTDLRYVVDSGLIPTLAYAERSLPFALRYKMSPGGRISAVSFGPRALTRLKDID